MMARKNCNLYKWYKRACGLAIFVMLFYGIYFLVTTENRGMLNKDIVQDGSVAFPTWRENDAKEQEASGQTRILKNTESSRVTETWGHTTTPRQTVKPRPTWPPMCPNMSTRSEEEDNSFKGMACHGRMPTKESCEYTAEKFKPPSGIKTCQNQKEPPYELCSITEEPVKSSLEIKCDVSICLKTKAIVIQSINPSEGVLMDKKIVETSNSEIEKRVKEVVITARSKGFPFIFLNCEGKKEKISQLLYVLPKFQFEKKDDNGHKKVNINIVLLDSISRAHFFRSLPKTVEYLGKKRSDARSDAHNLEFELFQAIHGHTHENEHAFFSGGLYPLNYSADKIDSSSTRPDILFKTFKNAGYQTLYMEDMCWKSGWGLKHSFQVGRWESFQKEIQKSSFDSTGITFSSCKILYTYGSSAQFYANKYHQICFNGKHYHTYHLEYLTQYFKTVEQTPTSKPLFSFAAINVAHDDVGIRVQTLDEDLVKFLKDMSKQTNTFTIVYADHGNTYTYYQVKMLEGRLEMYHPMMLAVVPKPLEQKLGSKALSNIITNQRRLFTLLDIREGIVELSKHDARSEFTPVGIFGNISKERECEDLILTKESICLCEGSFLPVEKSTLQTAIVELGVGELNNKIQKMLHVVWRNEGFAENGHLLFGFCQRLRIQSFKNIRERKLANGALLTSVDVQVQSGDFLKQEEMFTINVQSNGKPGDRSFVRELDRFERISMFGPYKKCADNNVDVRLCVCNNKVTSQFNRSTVVYKPNTALPKTHPIYEIISKSSETSQINRCLILIYRFYSSSDKDKFGDLKVYEMANICPKSRFNAHINVIDSEHVSSSRKLPQKFVFPPRSIYFLTTLQAITKNRKVGLSLRIHIT